jgi:multiple sugar transport system substrate-binding protein
LFNILFLGILLVQGCSTDQKDLTIWIGGAPQEVDYWEKLVAEFREQTGQSIRVVRQPADSDQRRQGLVISLEARQPDPDVFLMDVIWIGQFAYSGWLQSFDEYMQEDTFSLKPFFSRVIDLVDRYQDRLYALPVYIDGGLLYYRKDLLEEYSHHSVPQRWEELVKTSQEIEPSVRQNNPNFYGFVWQGAQYEGLVCTFLEFCASNGGGLDFTHGQKINSPENIEALQFMYDLIHRFRISPLNTYTEMKEEEVRRFFQKGNAMYERNWPYAWKLHQEKGSPVKGKVGISALPHFDDYKSASSLGGWHVGISHYSDVPEKAWKVVEYITSYDVQKKLVLNLGWNPGRKDVYSDPEVLEKLPHLERLQEVFRHAVARPNVPYYTQVSEIIQRYVSACLADRMVASAALQKAQWEVEDIKKLYGTE